MLLFANIDAATGRISRKGDANDPLGGLNAIIQVERTGHEFTEVVFLIAHVAVQRKVICVALKIFEYCPIPAGQSYPGPKLDDPAAISFTLGSVNFISFAASRANLP